jgi:hypothetical protein
VLTEEAGAKTTRLDLAIGMVLAHVKKLDKGSTFEVKAPNATTGVRGTVFFTLVTSDNLSLTGVLEGRVLVRGVTEKTTADVGEGQAVEARGATLGDVREISGADLDRASAMADTLLEAVSDSPNERPERAEREPDENPGTVIGGAGSGGVTSGGGSGGGGSGPGGGGTEEGGGGPVENPDVGNTSI